VAPSNAQIQSVGLLKSVEDTLGVTDFPSLAPKLETCELGLNLDVNVGGFLASTVGLITAYTLDIDAVDTYTYLDPERIQRLQFFMVYVTDAVNVGVIFRIKNSVTDQVVTIDYPQAPITGNYYFFHTPLLFGVDQILEVLYIGAGAGDTANFECSYLEAEPYCQVMS